MMVSKIKEANLELNTAFDYSDCEWEEGDFSSDQRTTTKRIESGSKQIDVFVEYHVDFVGQIDPLDGIDPRQIVSSVTEIDSLKVVYFEDEKEMQIDFRLNDLFCQVVWGEIVKQN